MNKKKKNNGPGIIIEKLSPNHMEDAIKLATEIFTYEQNIPEELIPINKDFQQIWCCARVEKDIVGIVAAWCENDKWHWGRFAVDNGLRGLGIGTDMAIFSLKQIFKLGMEEIFIDARDTTVLILKKLGCEVLGEAINFYGEPVTPIRIKKADFLTSIKSK
ncbi:GNAT family N-acetyltransferase [Clostridium sp. Marseille-Q2269]|uniref:GNAT family N-acetyltransferase n=1 Tax=Clostridium sp. Marseille-Q2269 TaxID=2942205 RepID=UPI002073A603|nr:GNAT family N-acetyltransferase [Clostridium sp. Marseille-Q2269]